MKNIDQKEENFGRNYFRPYFFLHVMMSLNVFCYPLLHFISSEKELVTVQIPIVVLFIRWKNPGILLVNLVGEDINSLFNLLP